MSEIKPDIIIPFTYNSDDLLPCAVVYVRPQTNKLNYEKAIIIGCQQYGDIVYLANINGRIFIKNVIILDHYSTQYFFAIHGKPLIKKYPEMVESFESHFHVNFDDAMIISSFDAQLKLNLTSEELFNTIVQERDFLKLYGQTIKRISNYYVVNYDLPAIIAKYTPESNVFVVAVLLKDKTTMFEEINQTIFDNLNKDLTTPIIDEDKLKMLKWYDMVRRTYHISCNHIASIFDMIDFVFHPDGTEITFQEIPFSNYLIEKGIATLEELDRIKKFNLVYIRNDDGSEKLINIIEEANGISLDACIDLFKRINYTKLQ